MSWVQDSFRFAETKSGTEVFELRQAQDKKLKRGYAKRACVHISVCVAKTSIKDMT